jgi:hypothetical protein
MVGKGDDWPAKGEIDIIEGINTQNVNIMTLHTTDNCSIIKTDDFTGNATSLNCYINAPGQTANQGCSIRADRTNTYGDGFNAKGGIYITEWTTEVIQIWQFPRSDIPENIKSGNPDPSSWGKPLAKFTNKACDIDAHFKDNQIVFDITFCGQWAGREWANNCPQKGPKCVDFVRDNPKEFADTFWMVNSLKVYRKSLII